MHWTPSEEVLQLVRDATGEPDQDKQAQLWLRFQQVLLDQANIIVLFQPIYQVAVRDSVGTFSLTAAGWLADVGSAKP